MLSRVAGSLYWMGRYLERSENITRLLAVTGDFAVEFGGLDAELAHTEWEDLLRALPGSAIPEIGRSSEQGLTLPYVNAILLEDANPLSVRHSITRARENARSIREALTREVFENLNETHRALEAHDRKRIDDPALSIEIVSEIHSAILTTLGAIEHTLSRDQGWTFMKLGEALERTLRTLTVLEAKLPLLRGGAGKLELPVFYARWRCLLRSVGSLENFRRKHGGQLDPDAVVRFLLFDSHTPRSIQCGLTRILSYLEQLPNGGDSKAARITGHLRAKMTYEGEHILEKPDLTEFFTEATLAIGGIHEALEREYFSV